MSRVIDTGRFLCGCLPSDKSGYSGELVENKLTKQLIYTDKRYDSEGFEICPEHGDRLYGFLSNFVERPGLGRVQDFARKGTDENFAELDFSVDDRRDNRDPEEVHRAIQKSRNRQRAKSNGH